MLATSFTSLLEEAALGGAEKRYSGNIADRLDVLFSQDHLEQLESHFDCFGILAFDPVADRAIVDYLNAGTLPSDSGPRLLVIWSSSESAPAPLPLDSLDWIDIERRDLVAQELIRQLFAPKPPPALPGIAFVQRISGGDEPIYFPLMNMADEKQIRSFLRRVFEIVNAAPLDDGKAFVNHLAYKAELARMNFRRAGASSSKQWLLRTLRFAKEHASDLISAISL